MIDVEAPSALLAVSGADIVLIAVPVAATEATFKAIKHLVTPQMLIMDVGSTKRDVVDAARRALREQVGSFVPAHPIAGKEVAGVEHADPDLYSGKQIILTPIERTQTTQVQQAVDVWSALGCNVLKMSPESHDAAFAAVSHLPHLIAFALMNAITGQSQGKDFLSLAGPGFPRLHAHRRQRPARLARHHDLQPRGTARPGQDLPAQPAGAGAHDLQRQRRGARRADRQASQARAHWSMNKNRR